MHHSILCLIIPFASSVHRHVLCLDVYSAPPYIVSVHTARIVRENQHICPCGQCVSQYVVSIHSVHIITSIIICCISPYIVSPYVAPIHGVYLVAMDHNILHIVAYCVCSYCSHCFMDHNILCQSIVSTSLRASLYVAHVVRLYRYILPTWPLSFIIYCHSQYIHLCGVNPCGLHSGHVSREAVHIPDMSHTIYCSHALIIPSYRSIQCIVQNKPYITTQQVHPEWHSI
jgi:hypothetical protein